MAELLTFFFEHGELYLHPLLKFSVMKCCEHERGVELSVLVHSFIFMIHNNTLRRLWSCLQLCFGSSSQK